MIFPDLQAELEFSMRQLLSFIFVSSNWLPKLSIQQHHGANLRPNNYMNRSKHMPAQ
jgi:hypothetical protein